MITVGRLLLVVAILSSAGSCAIACAQDAGASNPSATSQPAAVETLFTKEIAPGKQIVITRAAFDAGLLSGLARGIEEKGTKTFGIRVELHVGNAPPALLGSAIQMDYFADFRTGLNILDVYPATDELVVVCTSGDRVYLWRIVLDHHLELPDGWAWVSSPSGLQAAIPFTRANLSVVVSPQQTSPWKHQWKLTLVDKRVRGTVKTEFEQVTDQWKFARVTADTREHAVGLIKIPPAIRDINLVTHVGPMNAALDDDRFRKLMAKAQPLAPDDPAVRHWSDSLWYDGTFKSDDGEYHFQLHWVGGGTLQMPDGSVGFFSYSRRGMGDASSTRPARPAIPLGPGK